MKNIARQQASYSQKQRFVIYVIGGVSIAMLLFMSYHEQKMTSETLEAGKSLQVTITKVDCTNGKTKCRLYFRNKERGIKHVNVSYYDCQRLKPGDTIVVFENQDNDWYEINPVSLQKVNR